MMHQNNIRNVYKTEFEKYLGTGCQANIFWKGRVALYALLKAKNIGEGDEVILPAFTCVAVSAPIIYLKAKPVYVDIDPETYNIDSKLIEKAITKQTKAILVQNTFGLSSDLDPILKIAQSYNIPVIEDCSHGIGSKYKGRLNGTLTNLAFFSTQWNKMYSTGIGGISVTTDSFLKLKLNEIEESSSEPGFFEELNLKSLIFLRRLLSSRTNYFILQDAYRLLSRYNLVVGSNQGSEFDEAVQPENYLKKAGKYQSLLGLEGIKNIEENIKGRRKIAEKYYEIFFALGKKLYRPDSNYEHVYIKFSFLVDNKELFISKASEAKLEVTDWFLSPVHPILKNLHLWGYSPGSNPVAEKISRHIVNLPTHSDINDNYINKISDFLSKQRENIISSI